MKGNSEKYKQITLPHRLLKEIIDKMHQFPGREVAGVFTGKIIGTEARIDRIVFGKPGGWKRTCFQLDDKFALQHLCGNLCGVQGVFHVHPHSAPLPSVHDIKSMERTAVPWIIIGGGVSDINIAGYSCSKHYIWQVPVEIHWDGR